MGQYYKPILKEGNERLQVFSRFVIKNGNREYTPAKLTEHSWWYNPFVNALCEQIYNSVKLCRVIWMGDYADDFLEDFPEWNGLSKRQAVTYYKKCWRSDYDGKDVNTTDFTLRGKFLINHSKGQYIDCNLYYKHSEMRTHFEDGWCLHPLPLLTCIGNEYGGGDYRSPTPASTYNLVGTWAWDELAIDDERPEQYTEIFPVFKETGWED